MNTQEKRNNTMEDEKTPKRVKKECSYGDKCYRRNPAHFREFSHPHLEAILDAHTRDGEYPIPPQYSLQRHSILEQLEVIVEKQLYEPRDTSNKNDSCSSTTPHSNTKDSNVSQNDSYTNTNPTKSSEKPFNATVTDEKLKASNKKAVESTSTKIPSSDATGSKHRGSDYRPIVPPTRRAEDYLKVVRPRGRMADKHMASAPYHVFYTTITDARETHSQPFSITFQEILDSSLGELQCSLQINFMVEVGWLLAQYYFAGYSEKKLTILYGEDMPDLRTINKKKPHVDAHFVSMATPFGKHHTKMMVLCYEDGSLRVVISTANLYLDDWENRTQGLWFSPKCPELPQGAMPHDGDSPTGFKKSLLRYLNHYHMSQLTYYVERVKRCDFSHINVFLVASAPGSHFDTDWGMTRVASLLRQHCCVPAEETRQWALIAQASSIGSYGKEPKASSIGNYGKEPEVPGWHDIEKVKAFKELSFPQLWLTGDFLHNFTKIKNQSQLLSSPPELKVIYPSLENVKQSHDDLLGGGCLPYAALAHSKQPWLNNFLYQWKASSTNRNKAMPHIKSYTRISKDGAKAAYYLLTSGNVSKAAWGTRNKGDGALRIMSYEAGVLLMPKFVINEDFFPLDQGNRNRLVIPYDLPPTKYAEGMSPWVSDYLS